MTIEQIIALLGITIIFGIIVFVFSYYSTIGMNFQFETNQHIIDNLILNGKIASLINEFNKCGFSLLGVFSEKTSISSSKSITLFSEKWKAFGIINKNGKRLISAFYTPFENGEVLLTSNGLFPAINTKECLVETSNNLEIGKLLEMHKIRLQTLVEEGAKPYNSFSMESRIASARLFYSNRSIRKWQSVSLLKAFIKSTAILTVLSFSILMIYIFAATHDFRPPTWRFGWKLFTPDDGSFSVLMPQKPNEKIDGNLHTYTSQDA
jgi:hypothetical protein